MRNQFETNVTANLQGVVLELERKDGAISIFICIVLTIIFYLPKIKKKVMENKAK